MCLGVIYQEAAACSCSEPSPAGTNNAAVAVGQAGHLKRRLGKTVHSSQRDGWETRSRDSFAQTCLEDLLVLLNQHFSDASCILSRSGYIALTLFNYRKHKCN